MIYEVVLFGRVFCLTFLSFPQRIFTNKQPKTTTSKKTSKIDSDEFIKLKLIKLIE